ncbi:Mannosyl-glycoprotein endo-beta-N-acetylglucosaminidase [Paraburkholderia unamae]|nr:Mannosyl-glycoprotein endo-beta-N-acetylglucosaminidase [Paraburkholderia unamae]
MTAKYFSRIAASAALVVVAFGLVTFAQIKFSPNTADANPVAGIVLNVESWTG